MLVSNQTIKMIDLDDFVLRLERLEIYHKELEEKIYCMDREYDDRLKMFNDDARKEFAKLKERLKYLEEK
jgi:hypothetical protein